MKEGTIQPKFSLIDYDQIRNRSHSMRVPDIYELASCLDFVPKLK